jgi:hypothetical protein
MPLPLTLEEKKERVLERKEREKQEEPSVSVGGVTRRKRGVFNGTSAKLKVEGTIPGYHLHIINDDKNRIQDAQDGGYEFVSPGEIEGVGENVTSRNGDLGGKIRFLVGSKERGEPMYAYLMKQRQEWDEEDQRELQRRNDQIDAAVRAGRVALGDNPGFYVPREGIKMGIDTKPPNS